MSPAGPPEDFWERMKNFRHASSVRRKFVSVNFLKNMDMLIGRQHRLFQGVDKIDHGRGQFFLFPINDGQRFGAVAVGKRHRRQRLLATSDCTNASGRMAMPSSISTIRLTPSTWSHSWCGSNRWRWQSGTFLKKGDQRISFHATN